MSRLSNPVLPSPQKKEPSLDFKPCCVCQGKIERGYFGRWGDGGTCSAKCERIKEPHYEVSLCGV